MIDRTGGAPVCETRDLRKEFRSRPDETGNSRLVVALDGVSLAFRPGEVHAVVGENGAGKSTLMHVLSGLVAPTSGDILVDGVPRRFASPADALALGIAMVHQRPLLAAGLTVLENSFLGSRGSSFDRPRARARIQSLASKWNAPLDPDDRVSELGPEARFFAAFLEAVSREPRLLVLDEPTAVLGPKARDAFLSALPSLGASIVLVTHHLEEAARWADRVTVIRKGRVTLEADRAQGFSAADLEKAMFPADLDRPARAGGTGTGQVALAVNELDASARGRVPLNSVSLSVRAGSCVAVTGLAGSGLDTLEDALCGMLPADAGTLSLPGAGAGTISLRSASPRRLRDAGLALVPSDRAFRGSHPELTVAEVASVRDAGDPSSVAPILERAGLEIDPERAARTLSGGQLQRLILARELARAPRAVILASPDRGLDARSTAELKATLSAEAARGAAILVLTEDTDWARDRSFFDETYVLSEGAIE
jgi:simple sugar transport system ATP-binding protein